MLKNFKAAARYEEVPGGCGHAAPRTPSGLGDAIPKPTTSMSLAIRFGFICRVDDKLGSRLVGVEMRTPLEWGVQRWDVGGRVPRLKFYNGDAAHPATRINEPGAGLDPQSHLAASGVGRQAES
jgi:hypothetical protein